MEKDKLTPKQEKFCQKYIELGNASEAYRQSYDAEKSKPETINRKAKELLDNGKIAARVKELQNELKEKHDITLDFITNGLKKAIDMAELKQDVTNLRGGHMDLAKLHGLIIDKKELAGKDGKDLTIQLVSFTDGDNPDSE